MSDSMISLREKIVCVLLLELAGALELDAGDGGVLLELAHLGEPGEPLLLHLELGLAEVVLGVDQPLLDGAGVEADDDVPLA